MVLLRSTIQIGYYEAFKGNKRSCECRERNKTQPGLKDDLTPGALDPKLGRYVRRMKKITGPLLVQRSLEILGKLTLISANLSSN